MVRLPTVGSSWPPATRTRRARFRSALELQLRILALASLVALMGACGDHTARPAASSYLPCEPPPCPEAVEPPPGELPCYPASELDAIDRDVPISFEGDASAGTFVCSAAAGSRDLTRVQARLYQALVFMKNARFDAPLPWTSDALYGWFTGIVRGVRIRTDIESAYCDLSTHVLNLRGTSEWASGPESSFPQYVKILVHEARHIDTGAHTCGTTKDDTIAELGAYGVEYYLMIWLGEHDPGATEAERAYALYAAAALRCSVFCEECGG